MINSNELRIGNLIQCYRKAFDKEKTKHKISGIFFLDEFGDCVELEDGFIININKGIEPIPLTEEWLLKFGFYTNGINDIYYTLEIEEDSCDLYYLKEDKTIAIGQPYEAGGTELKFEYVHQLQNLYFALTGDELVCK